MTIDISGWSCDELNRTACRNSHGCHCREITALQYALSRKKTDIQTPNEDNWMKLANEAADEIDRLKAQIEGGKAMLRALRRVPSPSQGLGAMQRAMDMEVNAVIDVMLAGWPKT